MSHPEYTARVASWHIDRPALQAVRRVVFVDEQHVPEELEWDEFDETCIHVIALDVHDNPIGTGRLISESPFSRIGRMAVLPAWRGKGVGRALLDLLLELACDRNGHGIELHAQTHAMAFYARKGFVAYGPEFDEAGIPHRVMRLALPT